MSVKEEVLKIIMSAEAPIGPGEVETSSGMDRKEIDKALKQLKKENAIYSPIRCKWAPVKADI
jgi:hypothetical protein